VVGSNNNTFFMKKGFNGFNPHHRGAWLEELRGIVLDIQRRSFNPHHRGAWLEDVCNFHFYNNATVSIPIIVERGWK